MGRKSKRSAKEDFEPMEDVLDPHERQETGDFGRGDYSPRRGYTSTSVAQFATARAEISQRQSPRNLDPPT